MEGLARFYPHMIQATLVLLQGLGAGVIAADVVAWKLYSSPRLESARRPTPQVAAAKKPEITADLRGILRRNIFCATCEPITLDDLAVASGDPGQPPPMASLEGAELVGTMVVVSKPRDSLATVALTTHAEAKFVLLSEGDALGEAVVVSIESKRVIFMQDGQEKVLNLMGEAKVSPVVATAAPPPAAAGKPEDNQIRQVGPYKYEVDKSVISDFMKNMASASSGARVLPDPNGGFKVSFVRSFSVFYKLGIRSGDTISSVNNIQLDSIDQTFALYTKLKDANHLTLSVNRGGQTINMDYDIR